jgi:hypothetical protein
LVNGAELGPMLFVDPVPEPSVGALICTGIGISAYARRRRKKFPISALIGQCRNFKSL